jgi:hypothetical protein
MMEHYESLTIGISIVVGVVVLGLIWLAVKIAGWIVKAIDKRRDRKIARQILKAIVRKEK